MAEYRTVTNVPNTRGEPHQWVKDVIDYNIETGEINLEDDHPDDWNENLTSGRRWTFEFRARERHSTKPSVPPVEPVSPPLVGEWWKTQLARALALRDVQRGPRGTPRVLSPPVTLPAGLHEDIQITDTYQGRSLWLSDGTELAWSEIRNGGRVDLNNTSDRDQMVSHPWPIGRAVVRDSIITDSQWMGIGTGHNGLIQRCELARNSLVGVTFFFGIAEASLGKFWDSFGLFLEDVWCHDQQAMGPWWDGSGGTGGGVRGGLYERCGNGNQGVATYFELGGGFTIDGATFLDCDVAIRVQTDGLTIRNVVTVRCPTAVFGLNENRPDREGRPVVVDIADSYFDLTSTPDNTFGYGWNEWGGPGPTVFESDRNWFKVDPNRKVFRAGGRLLTFAEWQSTGRDQNSVLVER